MKKPKIIKIDQDKCNGCGQCVLACHEGVIKVINGKAKVINESFCDGLGACIGDCPQGAITFIDRQPEEANQAKMPAVKSTDPCGCPGMKILDFSRDRDNPPQADSLQQPSQLRQWPIQLHLLNPAAPYFKNADILIAADCVPFAYASFHSKLLKDNILIIFCPKLDDALDAYTEKLTAIFKNNQIKSVTVARMEVPCCFGAVALAQEAISAAGKDIPFKEIVVSLKGDINQ